MKEYEDIAQNAVALAMEERDHDTRVLFLALAADLNAALVCPDELRVLPSSN